MLASKEEIKDFRLIDEINQVILENSSLLDVFRK